MATTTGRRLNPLSHLPHSPVLSRARAHVLRLTSVIPWSSDGRSDTNSARMSSTWGRARGQIIFFLAFSQQEKRKAKKQISVGFFDPAPPPPSARARSTRSAASPFSEDQNTNRRAQRGRNGIERGGERARGRGGGPRRLFWSSTTREERKEEEEEAISLSSSPAPARAHLRYVLGGERSHGDDGRRARGTDAAERDGLEGGEGGHCERGGRLERRWRAKKKKEFWLAFFFFFSSSTSTSGALLFFSLSRALQTEITPRYGNSDRV